MKPLTRLLFPLPALRRSPSTLLGWWESRRPAYNAIVGSAGVLTLATMQFIDWLPPHVLRIAVPWQAVVVYGVVANACYSCGFLLEVLCEGLWHGEVAPVGPSLFRQGLIFSVGLTLLPIIPAWMSYLFDLVKWATMLS